MQSNSEIPPEAIFVWANQEIVRKFENAVMSPIIDKMMRHPKASGFIIAERFTLSYYRTLIEKSVELTGIEKEFLITGFLQYADAEGRA